MKNTNSVYNDERANSIFSKKMRLLFEESGKTHNNLAEYIKNETGERVTRQAIGQWCNGNTCPNLKTVPIIAKYFGVSTDYLLTDTEIRTPKADLKAVCDYTGLSEKSVINLRATIQDKTNSNLLFEVPTIKDIIVCLEEIKDLTNKLVFFQSVIYPIIYEDDFYNNMLIDNKLLCEHKCPDKNSEYCGKCDEREDTRSFIIKLLSHCFLDIFGYVDPCMDTWGTLYKDEIDLNEFKLHKKMSEIVEIIKRNCHTNPKDEYLYYYKQTRHKMEEYLKEEEEYLVMLKQKLNRTDSIIRTENKIEALKSFLKNYDIFLSGKE